MREYYSNSATKWAHDQSNNDSVTDSSNNKYKYSANDLSGAVFSVGNASAGNAGAGNAANNYSGVGTNTQNANSTNSSTGSTIFSSSYYIYFLWFLVFYCIAYFVLGYAFNVPGQAFGPSSSLSQMLDMLFMGGLLLFIITYYFSSSPDQQLNFFKHLWDNALSFINTPSSIFSIIMFIVIFYLIVYLLRMPMSSEGKPMFISLIESGAWILFVIIGINDFFKYILQIDLANLLATFQMWQKPPVDVSANVVKKVTVDVSKNEVFNISNNLYTYDDAQAICTAYGAKVATYDQVEAAYEDGGEWCNYGWSDGQMILFPTQKATWQKLQDKPEHKNDCGRPGINGGYIANPYMKFGVNCYGTKPKPTADDLNRMSAKQNQVYPLSEKDKALQAKVDYWKKNSADLLKINSYNTKKWSELSGN